MFSLSQSRRLSRDSYLIYSSDTADPLDPSTPDPLAPEEAPEDSIVMSDALIDMESTK
jgi:hypothetical protein